MTSPAPSPDTSAPAATAAVPRALIALLVVAAVVHVASFAWVVPNNDFIRDLLMSFPLARGEAVPLRGPVINDAGYLGPWWFLLLALPLSLGAGLTPILVFLGLLSTLKVPLAWRLGGRIGGAWLAFAFAAAMLLPGWDRLHMIQLTHTIVLEAALLAAWLPLVTLWRGGPASRWMWFGAIAGVAVHAHPVALSLALPAAAVAMRRRAQWRADLSALVIGVVFAALPLLPMVFAEWRDGWPVLAMAEGKLRQVPGDTHSTIAEVARALAGGAWTMPALLLPPAHAAIAQAGAGLLAIGAIAGAVSLRRVPALRVPTAMAACALLAAIVVLVTVRYRTPFYMAMLAWPALMATLAIPLAALAQRGRGGRVAVAGVAVAVLVASLAGSLGWIATTSPGIAVLPLRAISDIRHTDRAGVMLALMPVHAMDRVARLQCGTDPLRIHGELGALIDYYQRIPFRWRCPAMPLQLMGAGDDGRHWAGMTPDALRRLGFADADWRRAVTLSPKRVIAPAHGVDVVVDYRYPARDIVQGEPGEVRVAFAADADEAVAAYSPLFPYDAATTPTATCDGVAVAPVSTTNAGALFVPPRGAGCRWEIVVSSRVPAQLDVVTLPMAPRAEPPTR